ncbi:redoxin domain-containing protein [Pedobacter sp. SG918]|uniref:redoxin domain-containing protein n=1 Tax=Pedobacter sp. SG918 TaxID=2587136 RepID=UPI00146E632B|nr:redoxin domain-containing protein [Pedobacter sp. SG918]NMN37124.1 thiol-disulfide isomerase/thioredoxin [Pedobacter sp. SG918]
MKLLKTACSILLLLVAINATEAQTTKPADTLVQYLDKLVASKDSADKTVLRARLADLSEAKTEKEVLTAANYYYRIGDTKKSDAIYSNIATRFPLGTRARNEASKDFYLLKTAAEAEAAYKAWIKKFPPAMYENIKVDDRLAYDYVRAVIAGKFAAEKNVAKANEYANMLEVDFWKGNAYSGVTGAFYKNGDLANAEIYAKKAMDNSFSYVDGKKGNENWAKFSASAYAGLTSTYANILFERKKYAEALKYSEIAYKKSTSLSPNLNYRYAQILMGLNRNQEAYDKLEEVVKAGKATPEIVADFKKLYVKLKGNESGFDAYAASIRKAYLENLSKQLTKDIVKEPAAPFSLTDLNGKQVSLADYKGKIVILDFWATWCGPCKASFPAMQMAVNKYKDDENVKFLFIHTWEKVADPVKDAADYIKGKKYSFEVLMDLKDAQTKVNKVVSSYKVNGIPAKFVIDAAGNVRFKLTGFDGSNEAAVDELSMMIDMAKAK